MTVEQFQRLQAAEEREERRENRRIDVIEEGNFDLPGPGMRPRYQLPELDERFGRRLDSLQQLVGAEQNRLQPVTPPMYRLTPAQRQGIYSGINFMAELIEKNAVRPNDEAQLKLLRRMEAAAHASTSATSPSIYKTGAANLRYAQQNPRSWLDAKKSGGGGGGSDQPVEQQRNFVSSEQSSANEHAHSLEDTLLLDVRAAMVRTTDDPSTASVVAQPTPAMIKQVQFPYFMMLRDERRSLQYHSQHGAFLNYANALYRESLLAGAERSPPVPLGDAVRRSMRESGLSLVCVQFRYDARTLEVVLKINVEASYFGLLAFNIVAETDTRALRAAVKAELSKAYVDDVRAATVQQPTLGRLRDEKEQRQAMSEIAEFQHLACEYYKSHEELAADKTFGTPVDRLIARSSPMRILLPLKSPTLCALQVRYRYAYFANCQCFIDNEDLDVYKLRHATIARAQRAPGRRPPPPPPCELLPLYDSDEEPARVDANKRRRRHARADADDDVDDKK
jgi:hypothetical protein